MITKGRRKERIGMVQERVHGGALAFKGVTIRKRKRKTGTEERKKRKSLAPSGKKSAGV